MIEVSHLSKKYGTHPAIEDLSFTVGDGQIFGLLGPNGAGKSTIMNILTGYLAPTSGEVKVAGFSLPEQAQQAKACVGYLPEQPPLYPEMTVQEMNLRQRYGLNIIAVKRGEEVTVDIRPQMQLHAPDILAVVGRHDQVNRFENDLQNRKKF